ncbi:hypothetical protein CFK38_08965 [Brachybacterium vulturis]|uniref:Uncharacterized protein n=1 Tax=Brachybacterium vulturis TaxID=2017484 RepID=A0A291GN41_9MICO|nr:hypothetical protein CFK38_08965 [Brachybacterium vulturis]
MNQARARIIDARQRQAEDDLARMLEHESEGWLREDEHESDDVHASTRNARDPDRNRGRRRSRAP